MTGRTRLGQYPIVVMLPSIVAFSVRLASGALCFDDVEGVRWREMVDDHGAGVRQTVVALGGVEGHCLRRHQGVSY